MSVLRGEHLLKLTLDLDLLRIFLFPFGTRDDEADLLKLAPESVFDNGLRPEEHTSELQSLMRISYAVFCLKKKKTYKRITLYHAINMNTNTHTQQNTRAHSHITYTYPPTMYT